MAYPTPAVTVTTAATFIPEIWSDEIIAAYKKNLVLANIVMKMNFKGKKGDAVHIPAPTRGSASAKAASTAVTLIADTETEIKVDINKHFEYSRFIEDIVEAQALNSLRQFYTADAGYALAVGIFVVVGGLAEGHFVYAARRWGEHGAPIGWRRGGSGGGLQSGVAAQAVGRPQGCGRAAGWPHPRRRGRADVAPVCCQ